MTSSLQMQQRLANWKEELGLPAMAPAAPQPTARGRANFSQGTKRKQDEIK